MRKLLPSLALLACSLLAPNAHALTLYATSYEGHSIWQVDTVTQTATQIYDTTTLNPSNQPDSIIFDPAGNLLYTGHLLGTVNRLTLPGLVDTVLTLPTDGFAHPTDMYVEPSHTSVLVADNATNALRRVSLTGGPTSTLVTLPAGFHYSGMVYTPPSTGSRLFVNAQSLGGDQLLEMNPITGATINASAPSPAMDLDGLTYDPTTGHLWASSLNTGQLVEFDPNTLNFSFHALPTISGFPLLPDGVVADGLGNLFWASRKDFQIYRYDISTGLSTPVVYIFGLDDIAPLLTYSETIPEPASLSLLTLAALPLLARRRR